MSDLRVCAKCGWYDIFRHADECSPARGASAKALMAAVPLQFAQLGWGFGYICAELHDDYKIRIHVHEDGLYSVEGARGSWSLHHVVQWLNAIAATRIGISPDDTGQEVGARRHP